MLPHHPPRSLRPSAYGPGAPIGPGGPLSRRSQNALGTPLSRINRTGCTGASAHLHPHNTYTTHAQAYTHTRTHYHKEKLYFSSTTKRWRRCNGRAGRGTDHTSWLTLSATGGSLRKIAEQIARRAQNSRHSSHTHTHAQALCRAHTHTLSQQLRLSKSSCAEIRRFAAEWRSAVAVTCSRHHRGGNSFADCRRARVCVRMCLSVCVCVSVCGRAARTRGGCGHCHGHPAAPLGLPHAAARSPFRVISLRSFPLLSRQRASPGRTRRTRACGGLRGKRALGRPPRRHTLSLA